MHDLIDRLHTNIAAYLTEPQISDIIRAYRFAKNAHGTQLRFTGEAYITHPLEVAIILAQMRMDAPTLMAALLHDVLEDTAATQTDLLANFGPEVTALVQGVTKLTQIHFDNYAHAQAENFRKMLMAMANDIRVILVKLADRLHNMRTLFPLPPDKKRRVARETLEIFAPIANRLGMHMFRVELEDLGFLTHYPMRYRILQNAVNKALGNRQEIIDLIQTQIQAALEKHNFNSASVMGRSKHLYSIYRKMHEKHLSFSEIMDVYGFRIITHKIDTCYRILGVLHNLYKPIAQRFKDYIAIPKANGYQSLHTTLFGPYGVPIEIQIRTQDMHETAENGIAAHWLYKAGKSAKKTFSDPQSRARAWLKEILEVDKSSHNSLEFISNIKIDLFPDDIYVFTPKGKIIELPAGATPIDFAYAIHSDIGDSCIAARLNKRLAPLSTPLTSGQQVEIITAPSATPNSAWLNFVVTGKARSKIKQFLKKQQREEASELGRQLLSQELATYQIELDQITKATFTSYVASINLASTSDLFEEIGIGSRPAQNVAKQLAKIMGHAIGKDSSALAQVTLAIKGSAGSAINFSSCCRPIPGDPIAGLIRQGHGIDVHTLDCPHLRRRQHLANQCIALSWEEDIEGDFAVDLDVDLINRRGSLASLTGAISEAGSNIMHIRAQESDPYHFHAHITITVHNRSHLAKILLKIRKRQDVLKVQRHKA